MTNESVIELLEELICKLSGQCDEMSDSWCCSCCQNTSDSVYNAALEIFEEAIGKLKGESKSGT